jgi:hypothetical protein
MAVPPTNHNTTFARLDVFPETHQCGLALKQQAEFKNQTSCEQFDGLNGLSIRLTKCFV